MRIPKYIQHKAERINALIEQANLLKSEIDQWAINNGADIYSTEWNENVRDECTGIVGIFIDGIEEYFHSVGRNE